MDTTSPEPCNIKEQRRKNTRCSNEGNTNSPHKGADGGDRIFGGPGSGLWFYSLGGCENYM